jgi:Cu2+-exporting ATPase
MFFMDMPYANWIMLVLATPVVFYFGRNFFINAFKQARNGKASMDTLVALSTGVAWLFSTFNTLYPEFWHARGLHAHVYFEAAAVVIAFISLGKLLEEKAKSNTSSALKKLIGLQPQTVTRVLEDGSLELTPIQAVLAGQLLLVKPGEKIPVDGSVQNGSSYVDESMISGEPVPVLKQAGEKLFAGTINQKGSFQFIAEKVGSDTVLAQIIRLVKEAQGSKAPVQRLVDKIAGIFVPIVIGISILTFISWMILGGENAFTHGLLTAITVLVIACPCALGLATPTAIMVGVGKGAENNILIKDAESLERAHLVNAIVLDKTGTITEGHPTVEAIEIAAGYDPATIKAILAAIESRSEHPLADAVVRYLKTEGVKSIEVDSAESITGMGIKAAYNGKQYTLGNQRFLEQEGVTLPAVIQSRKNQLELEANTVILLAENKTVVALVAITDKIKSGSAAAIAQLEKSGVEVYMLTGDNRHTAAAIARQLNLKHFEAEQLPGDKAEFIKQLKAKGKIVAMVGDGINDSQALAEADVSIAMGKGSDIAMDVAKMTLIGSDLNSIPKALNLSHKTVHAIRQNLFWAFIYNIIGIPLAAGILYPVNGFLLDPMIAGAAMALSSVSVVANSLRLKFSTL